MFYVDNGRLLAVPVRRDPTFSRGTATVVIDVGFMLSDLSGLVQVRRYDIDPSGERFLVVKPAGVPNSDTGALPSSLMFVLNWFEELKAQFPSKTRCRLHGRSPRRWRLPIVSRGDGRCAQRGET